MLKLYYDYENIIITFTYSLLVILTSGCYNTYVFLPTKFYANKLISYSELIIFIGYENNGYQFIHHIQENIILCFICVIFDERLFPKYTNSHTKEHKLYDESLEKISLEKKLLVSNPSRKNRPASVSISHIPIPSIQNNSPTYSSSLSLSYRSISPLPTPVSKNLIVEIEENNNVDSDVEM